MVFPHYRRSHTARSHFDVLNTKYALLPFSQCPYGPMTCSPLFLFFLFLLFFVCRSDDGEFFCFRHIFVHSEYLAAVLYPFWRFQFFFSCTFDRQAGGREREVSWEWTVQTVEIHARGQGYVRWLTKGVWRWPRGGVSASPSEVYKILMILSYEEMVDLAQFKHPH